MRYWNRCAGGRSAAKSIRRCCSRLSLHLLEARDLVDPSDASMAFSLAVDRGLGEVLGYLITGAIIDGFVSFGAATDSTDCSTRVQASSPSPSPTTC